jgi:hypothetical protein
MIGPTDLLSLLSGLPFGLVLAEEAFEETPVSLLVAQDIYDHVLRDVVDLLGRLDDPGVVLYGPGLGLDHALYNVHHVYLHEQICSRGRGAYLSAERIGRCSAT